LKDENHAQKDILLIELHEQYVQKIGVKACSHAVPVAEHPVEISTGHTIDSGEKRYTSIAEVNVEWLKYSVNIGWYWHEHEIL
jgi:hypothetical protein